MENTVDIDLLNRKFKWPRNDKETLNIILEDWNIIAPKLNPLLPNRRTVIQAGGHCGVYPLLYSDIFQKVFTFEPDAVNFMHLVMNYVGMNNWEHVHSFSGVCKLWRFSCLPHLSNIGITKMDGGENHKLNVAGFLQYLTLEKFRHMQCIFIPCARAKGLFVDDIRRVCPSVRIIVHSQWLKINGLLEEAIEGEATHQCYRVYRHDKEYTEGENVWVQWTWDNKYQLVSEHQFVRRNIRRYRRRTDFFGHN